MTRPNWYLKDVEERKNHNWTLSEKVRVYTLRKNNTPIKLIAIKFGVEVVSIYNILRIVRKGLKDKCFICGKPIRSKEEIKEKLIKACPSCRKKMTEYKKERRKKALKKGLCGYCEKNPIVPGHTACRKCLSATHRRRYKKNLCGKCGKRPIAKNSISLCKKCLKENYEKILESKKVKHEISNS